MKNLKTFEGYYGWDPPDYGPDPDPTCNRDMMSKDYLFESLIESKESESATPGGFFAMKRKGTNELWLLNTDFVGETGDFLNYRTYYIIYPKDYSEYSDDPEVEYSDDVYEGDYLCFATDLYQGNDKELSNRDGDNWRYMSSKQMRNHPEKMIAPYYTADPKKIQESIEGGEQPYLYKINAESAGYVIDSAIGFIELMQKRNPQGDYEGSFPLLMLLHDTFGDELQGFKYEAEFKNIIKRIKALKKFDTLKKFI
jgi:hypothetical protein